MRRLAAAIRFGLFAIFALAALDAAAIGLGSPVLDSGLGEPLRLSVPVTLQSDEEIGCIQVRARGSDLPTVFNTRSSVVRSGGQSRIEITSAQPVNEPAIGLVVSVGCTAAVSREFSLFLDPPIAASPPIVAGSVRSVVEPTVPRGLAQTRPRRTSPSVGASSTGASSSTEARPARRSRPARIRPPANPVADATAGPSSATPPTSAPPPNLRDRLSVVPTEPSAGAPVSSGAPATATPAPASTPAAAPPSTPNVAPAGTVAAATDPDATAREQALRQQQAVLEAQLKSLSDQIAALRVQATTLAARNQALENGAFSPSLVWLLIALAVIAILVAGWMAWRYTQLRRSLEGSPWWTGNTMQAPTASSTRSADRGADPTDFAPLDAGTRLGARPMTKTDTRAGNVALPPGVPSNVERSRPAPRSQGYPSAIETDFTVSDIEAAMATVRTVSPPRKAPPPHDSDFAPLGGPTLPSPFTEPPPPAPRTPAVDDEAKFVDLDIPPMPTSPAPARVRPLTATDLLPTRVEKPLPLDLKLDLPTNFDPLSTDSHKRTVVDQKEPDYLPGSTTSLDLELPSATMIAAMTSEDDVADVRHGSTALDNLFASDTGKLGPDTILDLDDRHGSPLSATEVDRLTMIGSNLEDDAPPVQGRLTAFAEVMNQVDEAASSDPLRAIALLRQFVLRDENIPTLLWLRLFELYKAVDKRMVYDALAEHFARRYNRPMVAWNESLVDRAPQAPLASFRELDQEVESSWGTEAGLARLDTLLCGRDQSDAIVFNAVLQRDLLDIAKIFLLDRDSSIQRGTK